MEIASPLSAFILRLLIFFFPFSEHEAMEWSLIKKKKKKKDITENSVLDASPPWETF